jgi:structural maintenance of chromosomes protein 6
LKETERKIEVSRSRLDRCKEALSRHKKQEKELEIIVQRLDEQVEETSDAIGRDTVEEGRLEELRNFLQGDEEQRIVHNASIKDAADQMEAILAKLKATKREMANKDADIAALEEQQKIAENEQAKVKEQRRRLLSEKNAAINHVAVLKQEYVQMEQKRDQLVARVLDYSEQASKVSPRVLVDEGETTNSLDKKLDRLHRDMQRFNDE